MALSSSSLLHGIQLNCRSISNKLGEIKLMLYTKKPDFMALSETWISNSKYEPRFVDYQVEWKHRVNGGGHGGGLGLVLRKGIQYSVLNITSFAGGMLEVQGIKIYMSDGYHISLLHIYNPNKYVQLNEILHYIAQLGNRFMIIGDFNAHSPLLSSRCKSSDGTGRAIEDLASGGVGFRIFPQSHLAQKL